MKIDSIKDIMKYLSPEQQAEINHLLVTVLPIWTPLPGPQTEAYLCEADELFYGGSAGGGKSDLLLGLALTQQHTSIIFRRQSTQLLGIQNRLLDEIIKSRKNWNGQDDILRLPDRTIEFGSCNIAGDEIKYQGRPHALKGFDEITHFQETQYQFLCGWKRSTVIGEKQRIVCVGNPPTDADGEWVIKRWGPWLNKLHPNPAKPGELRWYAVIDGIDTPVESAELIYHGDEIITPQSRTFIPSHVEDNPFLMATGYKAQLQALPEPLRSQMLKGDFTAGMQDDVWQIIPTGWIEAAISRWTPEGKKDKQMDSVGVDVARGGADKTIITARYGRWYDQQKVYPGATTPDGPTVAGLVVAITKDSAPIHVDVIGVGTSVYDHLYGNSYQVIGINNASTDYSDKQRDKSGKLEFKNNRAYFFWMFREMLDPAYGHDIAIPPDPELKADLCAPRWKLTPSGVQVEQKDEIKKRIGRSPDKGDSFILASINTVKNSPRRLKDWRKRMPETSWRSA